jgi:hypothetical protein
MDRALLAKVPQSPQGQGGLAAGDADAKPDRGVVVQMLRRLLQVEPAGFITDHLREVLHLPPEISRIDMVTFVCDIAADGTITTQPGTVRLDPDYEHELFGIIGWMQDPENGFAAIPLVSFNIREQGRNFDIFVNNPRMAGLVTSVGTGNQVEYPRGAYVFRRGADVQVRFNVTDVVAYNALVDEDKLYGIVLLNNMARKK